MKKSELRLLIKEVIEDILSEGPRDPAIFKAIFLAGGPGAGKSFVVNKLGLDALGFKKDDPDIMYKYLINRHGFDIKTFDIGSDLGQSLRQNAANLTDKRTIEYYIKNRLGVIFDGTGKDFSKINNTKQALESIGYETFMVFINADLDTSIKRNSNRDRKVPDAMVKDFWSRSQKNIGNFQSIFGSNFIVIDNSSDTDPSRLNSTIQDTYRKLRSWTIGQPTSPIAKKWINDHP